VTENSPSYPPLPSRERAGVRGRIRLGNFYILCLSVDRGEGDVILFFAESRPKDVWISLEQVARLKNLDPAIVSEQTTINASQFFKIFFQRKD